MRLRDPRTIHTLALYALPVAVAGFGWGIGVAVAAAVLVVMSV